MNRTNNIYICPISVTIPEGNVTQITDASGVVIWSATIKFTMNGETEGTVKHANDLDKDYFDTKSYW